MFEKISEKSCNLANGADAKGRRCGSSVNYASENQNNQAIKVFQVYHNNEYFSVSFKAKVFEQGMV